MIVTTTHVMTPVDPRRGALRPLGVDQVSIDGGFWGDRQERNRKATVPHIAHWEERTGWLANFDAAAAGTVNETRTGREFSDSEIYKLLEAMAWEIGRTNDEDLEAQYERIVQRVVSAQRDDGYLNTRFGNPGQPARYSDLEWGHELYCFGHLFQAAVARIRTGRGGPLVDAALRAADHVCETFGENGIRSVCGHAEIEPALVELSRATGEERYLAQARLFLDRRGNGVLADIELGRAYYQDDQPIREAEVLRGHAVRALYLSAGAIDAGVDEGDDAYVDIVRAQYRRTLARRTYLTGGMGSHHQDEAFGDDFELPPDRAYCETCAGIGSVMVAWRLLLATGDLSYGDVIERTLYNVVAASPNESGDAFFYTNPLQQRRRGAEAADGTPSPRAEASLRAPWFDVSCCPPNVARTLAQLGAYVAASDEAGVVILQYVSGEIRADVAGGEAALRMTTAYPDDGSVDIEVLGAPENGWTLTLRIPAWAEGARIRRGDEETAVAAPEARVENLRAGEHIALHLPIAPRITTPDPRIDAVRGTVAVERGPLVLCAESVDFDGDIDLAHLRIDPAEPLRSTLRGAVATGSVQASADSAWPYSAAQEPLGASPAEIPLVPYHSWANRGPSTMRVWIPTV